MKTSLFIIISLLPLICQAQVRRPMSFAEYTEQVRAQNLAYAAEKLNIPIAEATIRSAKVFNDPTLSVEYAYNDDARMQMGQGMAAELSKTFSPGKRRARIDLAHSEREMTVALTEYFFRNLLCESTAAYLEAIKQSELYEVKLNSYNSINDLAKADSIKFELGKITAVDAMQSRIEASVSYNDLLQAQSDLHRAYVALNVPLGRFSADTLYVPTGTLELPVRNFSHSDLLDVALNNRSDLAAALKNVDVAKKALKLTIKERYMDFDIALGYNYNTEVRNELAPAPRFNGVTVGVAIPLKFSNTNKGAVQSATFQASQAEKQYREAQIEVQTELSQNYNAYTSICSQVLLFNKGVLDEAKAVIDGKRYSYNRGETSLLEVLTAQRTYNDVRTLYIETLFNQAMALVTLERSAGIWDVEVR